MAPISKKRLTLNENFRKIILKFSMKDIKKNILSLFQDEELTWELIKKAILKYNLSCNIRDVAAILLEYTKPLKIEDLQQIYSNLVLKDVILHHTRKVWVTINMRQRNDSVCSQEFSANIKRAFKKLAKSVDVYSEVSEDIRFFVIVISRRTQRKGIIQQKPIFFAHPLETAYLFHSPKRINADLLTTFVSGLGYDDNKKLKLEGRSILSLLAMLKRRENAAEFRAQTAEALKNSTDLEIKRTAKGINFCHDEVRLQHAKAIFGEQPIQLETLLVKAKTEWRGLRTLPEAAEKEVKIKMQLRSKNLNDSLKELMRIGAIKAPYPAWMTEFSISGKNELQIG